MEDVQAIIMAGGEGVRLRPLTVYRPKPLVPLLGEPVMGYALRLLKIHGITDVGATLWYRPWDIQAAFGQGEQYGVQLRYYEETAPVGTAGSVGLAREHIRGTFAVLSGDGLTDCDLRQAIAFHREKQALATLVLKRVHVPLPYGVVMCDGDGRITRFLEKPAWSRVFSNLVNTGIYILEPEIFEHIPTHGASDFGKDVFPDLVAKGLPVYGFETADYWCDVGEIHAYLTAQGALLRGETAFTAAPFVDPSARIHPDANVGDNCFIGPDAVVGPGAQIAGSALGAGCTVGAGAVIENACLWNRAAVGEKARVQSAVLCTGAALRQGAEMSAGCALGEGAAAGEYARLLPGVRIWPHGKALPRSVIDKNLLGGDSTALRWTDRGVCCDTAEDACSIVRAYAAKMKPHRVLAGCGADAEAYFQVICGALAANGCDVCAATGVSAPMLRWLVSSLRLDGGVFAQKGVIRFLDGCGRPLPARTRDQISALALQKEAAAEFARPGRVTAFAGAREMYLARVLPEGGKPLLSPLAVVCPDADTLETLRQGLERLRVRAARFLESDRMTLRPGETAFFLDAAGESLRIEEESGPVEDVQKDMLLLRAWLEKTGKLYDGPGVPRAAGLLSPLLPADESPACAEQQALMNDGAAALFLLCEIMKQGPIRDQLLSLPETHLRTVQAPCQPRDKGRVLRALCGATTYPHTLGEGVRIQHEKGFATIVPDGFRDQVRVTGESQDSEFARELCDFYLDQIRRIVNTP